MSAIEVNSLDEAYGQPVQTGDRVWVRFMASRGQAGLIVAYLAEQRIDFTFDPEGVEYEITVKPENKRILEDAIRDAG